MDSSPAPASQHRDPDGGRVAVPEIAELLHLQRSAAAVAAAAVVLLGLLVALVLPDLLPANALTGAVVGILALVAGLAAAVVLDGRDPVLRGPRHLRRDGHTVLARMAGPDAARHGAPVLAALERRLEGREHLGVVLTGSGTDPSRLAAALGRGAAAAGHTSLVIDLRAPGAPGVADVGEGTVRLGEAAQLAEDRPYAWIGAGADRAAAARAAAGVARRPPRDLQLLLVVAPEAATHVHEVLAACDRTVLLVAADTQQRAMVTARIDALRRAGARTETVVVGGVRVADEGDAPIDTLPDSDVAHDTDAVPGTDAAPQPGADAAAGGHASVSPFAPDRSAGGATADEPTPDPGEPEVPSTPGPPPTVPEEPDADEPEPTAPPSPEPDAPPVVVPDRDGAHTPDTPHARGTAGSGGPGDDAGAATEAGQDTSPDDVDPFAPRSRDDEELRARDEARRARDEERRARDEARRARDEARRAHAALGDTGPIPPVFRTTAPSGDTEVAGMADSDALVTTAALEQLLVDRDQSGWEQSG